MNAETIPLAGNTPRITTRRRLRVAIDFRVADPRQGVGMSTLGLIRGLGKLAWPDQEYFVVVYDHSVDWITPHILENCSVVAVPSPTPSSAGGARNLLKRIRGMRALSRLVFGRGTALPMSDGTVERLGCDIVHFPCQSGYVTDLPSIYQPWDLQHVHFPQFFSRTDLAIRELVYRGLCEQATRVCITTEWGKRDLSEQYGIAEEKIAVIRMGTPMADHPPLSAEEAESTRRELNLPASFLLYPAITWPHKNHENLLRGLALLKQQTGSPTHLCLTGAPGPGDSELTKLAHSLGLEAEVHILGFVSARQLQALYRMAVALVFPSLFEGLGLPVLEAFGADLPVACAAATVLPEVAGDAAVYFAPQSPGEIASAIALVLGSAETRRRLVARGRVRLQQYAPEAAAVQFAMLYQQVAGLAANEHGGANVAAS